MIRINHLSLHLPAEFRDRAGEVVQHAASALAEYPVGADRRIDRLGGLSLTLPQGASSAEAGRALARSIADAAGLTGGRKDG